MRHLLGNILAVFLKYLDEVPEIPNNKSQITNKFQ
jgi:hypothetical protein